MRVGARRAAVTAREFAYLPQTRTLTLCKPPSEHNLDQRGFHIRDQRCDPGTTIEIRSHAPLKLFCCRTHLHLCMLFSSSVILLLFVQRTLSPVHWALSRAMKLFAVASNLTCCCVHTCLHETGLRQSIAQTNNWTTRYGLPAEHRCPDIGRAYTANGLRCRAVSPIRW